MTKDVAKTAKAANPSAPTTDAASRLKHDLMADALGRMFSKEADKPIAPGTPRVLLALANHGRSPGWERAKTLQRQMFETAAGSGLEMKFAFYGRDDDQGVRQCRITTHWITDPDDMASLMDRAECNCGCYVHINSMLERAVTENADRPMRAVIIVGDAFHDSEDSLTEAALAANQLRRQGTRVFLIQQGDDSVTARKLQHLHRVSGAAYFKFDPNTQQQQFAEMLKTLSAYTAGGEAAVKAIGGQAANLLLEHLKQQPMPILDEERDRLRVDREAIRPAAKTSRNGKQRLAGAAGNGRRGGGGFAAGAPVVTGL
jgi:hypothetical protein